MSADSPLWRWQQCFGIPTYWCSHSCQRPLRENDLTIKFCFLQNHIQLSPTEFCVLLCSRSTSLFSRISNDAEKYGRTISTGDGQSRSLFGMLRVHAADKI